MSQKLLGILLWKNWLLIKQSKFETFLVIGFPVFFMVKMIAPRMEGIGHSQIINSTSWDSFPIKEDLPDAVKQIQVPGTRCSPKATQWDVFFSPDSPVISRLVHDAAARLGVNPIGFHNEASLLKKYTNMDKCHKDNIMIAIVFSDKFNDKSTLPQDITYSLRPKAEKLEAIGRNWYTELSFPSLISIGPRNSIVSFGGDPDYYNEGFLTIQRAIDCSIIREIDSDASQILNDLEVRLKRHPYPAYKDDLVVTMIGQTLSWTYAMCIVMLVPYICKDIVLEKDHKLKETMKMMGMKNWLHWTAWSIKFFILQLIIVTLLTIVLHADFRNGAFLAHTDPSVTFVFSLLYAMATLVFCFVITTLCSKASSSMITGEFFYILALVPWAFVRKYVHTLSTHVRVGASIDFLAAMGLGCSTIAQYESVGVGMQWSNLNQPFSSDNGFTMMHVMLMLLLDIVVYGVITWYFDNIFPGEFGLPKPYYFPFMKTYWCGSLPGPDNHLEQPAEIENSEFFESTSGGKAGISIRNLRKEFRNRITTNVAVEGTTLDMHEGQIFVLLGQNGAGKTTTMMMLTGYLPPTSGNAHVGGYSINQDMDSVRESLGLCPQHNVIFDELTVEENLTFFAEFKGSQNVKEDVTKMIQLLNLEVKRNSKTKTLSGGMKRKLSVGIALIGVSKVVILDEPTSGMDAGERRQTWNILQSKREGRTILLSSHLMDEADFLGDRIAIMAEGRIVCCGSSLFIKEKYGIGYHMTIDKLPNCNADDVTKVIKGYVPEAKLSSNNSAELSYVLPHGSSPQFEQLFTQIEKHKAELGIVSFGASVTTLDEVFLKVGQSIDPSVIGSLQYEADANQDDNAENSQPRINHQRAVFNTTDQKKPYYQLVFQQVFAMIVKRAIYTRRNYLGTLQQLIIPVVFTIIACFAFTSNSDQHASPPYSFKLDHFYEPISPYSKLGPANANLNGLVNSYEKMIIFPHNISNIYQYTDYPEQSMDEHLLSKAKESLDVYKRQYMIAFTFSGKTYDAKATTLVTGHFNDEAYHTPAITLNILSNILLQFISPDHVISSSNFPLPRNPSSGSKIQFGTYLDAGKMFTILIGFALAYLFATFVIFLVKENSTHARHLQFVSGVTTATFWLSTFIWDLINYLVPALFMLLVVATLRIDVFISGSNLGVLLLLLVLYAWAALPLVYLLSFIFTVPSSGVIWIMIGNILTGMLVIIIRIRPVWKIVKVLLKMLLPNFSFGSAVFDMFVNYGSKEVCMKVEDFLANLSMEDFCNHLMSKNITNSCCIDNCGRLCAQTGYLDWNSPGVGKAVLTLVFQGVLFMALLCLVESAWMRGYWQRVVQGSVGISSRENNADGDATEMLPMRSADSDVQIKRQRIMTTPLDDVRNSDALIIQNLYKYYGPLLAVDGLTVGIPRGECFGLLGASGAGKTSLLKMLTGDERISFGNAYINGYSVKSDLMKVHQCIGYCPQFDALIDHLTVRETLRMYARLRGLTESAIEDVIKDLMTSLCLDRHSENVASELSGGNKRKLSVGIALVGDPPVIFLDEPSTGLDPLARRLLWDTLTRVRSSGRTLVVTSHSMEECDANCTRVAIIVNGQFRCLGSTQHLKSKYVEGYTLIAKIDVSRAPTVPDGWVTSEQPGTARIQENAMEFMAWMENTFPGSVLKDGNPDLLQYQLPMDREHGIGHIFGCMERAKEQFGLQDYSVSQTTLEQVFLAFARTQVAPKETSRTCVKCANCLLFCCCCSTLK